MNHFVFNHLYPVAGSGALTIGNPKQALIFALVFTFVILLGYFIIDQLPKPEKNKITPKNEANFVKAMLIIISLAAFAGAWDIWWHRAIGRDSFWIAPHLFLYSLVMIAMGLSFYVWRHCRDLVWKYVFFTLMFIPIAAVFDNFFHTLWGAEDLSQPVRLPWSPGHLLLLLSVMATVALLLKILFRFRNTNDFNFFGNLGFGMLIGLTSFLLIPFHPTEGFGQVAGFAGAGVLALGFIMIILTAQHHMKGRLDATLSLIVAVMFMLTTYGKETASQIILQPHDRAPNWLIIFALLALGLLMDITKDRFQTWTRGLMAGIVWSAILFGFANIFFAPQFQYGLPEIFTAIAFSALGGLVAGSVYSLTHLRDEEHIRKMLEKF